MVTAHRGIVATYHRTKQWGFLREKDGTQWFFHLDNCVSGFQSQIGVSVEFLIGPPFTIGKPDQAIDVRGVQS